MKYSSLILKGGKVEREHMPTYNYLKKNLKEKGKLPSPQKVFNHISKDHIMKDGKNYYPFLKKMEITLSKNKR